MLGSLNVAAQPTTSPMASTVREQNSANQSAQSGSSQPPRWLAQRGVVKWWKVTIGVTPCARHASQTRR